MKFTIAIHHLKKDFFHTTALYWKEGRTNAPKYCPNYSFPELPLLHFALGEIETFTAVTKIIHSWYQIRFSGYRKGQLFTTHTHTQRETWIYLALAVLRKSTIALNKSKACLHTFHVSPLSKNLISGLYTLSSLLLEAPWKALCSCSLVLNG